MYHIIKNGTLSGANERFCTTSATVPSKMSSANDAESIYYRPTYAAWVHESSYRADIGYGIV